MIGSKEKRRKPLLRIIQKMEYFGMICKRFLGQVVAGVSTILSTFLPLSASAQGLDDMKVYDMSAYLGAGIGQSDLSPQHVKDQGFTIDDFSQTSWKLTGGLDVNKTMSVEAYYSDLGRTSLSPNAEIGYRMLGADAIFHYWAQGEERLPGSIALYAKAGLNHTNTYSRGRVEENNDLRRLFAGIGAELFWSQKFSLRLEFESYNADASLLSLNVIKRFGLGSKRSPQKEFIEMVKQLPKPAAGPRIVVITPVVIDSDLDGYLDDEDQCPATQKGMVVDQFGCAVADPLANDHTAGQ